MIPQRIENISSKWFYKAPYLCEFILQMTFFEKPKIGTMGVGINRQNHITLCYNQSWVDSLSDLELEGVMLHEINHLLNFTHARGSGKKHELFNIASDMIINYEIENEFTIAGTKLLLPKIGCRLADIPKYDGKRVTEDVYEFLLQENKDKGEYITLDNHEGLDNLTAEQQVILDNIIESIKESAKARSYGSMSSNMQDYIKELLKPKGISLQTIIRKQLQEFVFGRLHKYQTWKRINRKSALLPGKGKKGIRLNLVVDTSGSCFSPNIQRIFFSEIEHIASKIEELKVIEFDTEIKKAYNYKRGSWKKIAFVGGGGTEIQPVFDYLRDKHNKSYTICFTDGEFNWSNLNLYNNEVLWAIYDGDNLNLTTKGLF